MSRTLLGALLALVIDRLTHKRLPLAAVIALAFVASLLFGANAGAGRSQLPRPLQAIPR